MTNVTFAKFCASAAGLLALAGVAVAVPTNTTLPGGWSWQPLAGGSYDTGLVGTAQGGGNGQTTGPFNDTSYGVMNEPGTPWFTGNDLTSQQYIQRQAFGNFGTGSPPGPAGFRYYNFGYGGQPGPTFTSPATAAGTNFPATGREQRGVTVNQWNNTAPDAGGVASFGQIVRVPIAATLSVGLGWGGDDMLLKAIGGPAGGVSEFRIDANIDAAWNTSAFGGLSSAGNRINVNGIARFNNPGPAIGNFDMPWGFGVPLAAGQISLTRGFQDFVQVEGVQIGDPGQGLTPNSVGYAFTKNFNVLAAISQDGSPFSVDFASAAELFISRLAGVADARAQMGPGFEGNVRLVVQYAEFRAVPTPAAACLLGLGGLVAARRRRAR